MPVRKKCGTELRFGWNQDIKVSRMLEERCFEGASKGDCLNIPPGHMSAQQFIKEYLNCVLARK